MSDATESENGGTTYEWYFQYYSLDRYKVNHDPSLALGQRTHGSLDDGLNLPDQSHLSYEDCGGYKVYILEGVEVPNTEDWGTATSIRVIEDVAHEWATTHGVYPHVRVGDISKQGGGYFYPHDEHQNGLDIDLRYVGNGNYEDQISFLNPSATNYNQQRTADLVNLFASDERVLRVIVDSRANLPLSAKVVLDTSNEHANHFHVSVIDPDGTNNSPPLP